MVAALADTRRQRKAGGKVLGLGLEADLTVFKGTGAIIWKNAGWQRAGLTRVDWGRALVSEYHFKESFKEAAQNAGSIKFDLSDFKLDYSTPGITNFEFSHIISHPLKSFQVLSDVDLLIKRCGLVCKKRAICLQNLADFYVV